MKLFQRAMCIGIAAALALPVATTATARDSVNTIELLSHASGLTVRQVMMVLGNPTAFGGYKSGYEIVDNRLRRTVGPEIYRQLKLRRELTPKQTRDLIAMAAAGDEDVLASK